MKQSVCAERQGIIVRWYDGVTRYKWPGAFPNFCKLFNNTKTVVKFFVFNSFLVISFVFIYNFIVGTVIFRTSDLEYVISIFDIPPSSWSFKPCVANEFIGAFNSAATNVIPSTLGGTVIHLFTMICQVVVKGVNFILNFLVLCFHPSQTTKHVFMTIIVYQGQRRFAPPPLLSCLFSVMGIGNLVYIFRAMVRIGSKITWHYNS